MAESTEKIWAHIFAVFLDFFNIPILGLTFIYVLENVVLKQITAIENWLMRLIGRNSQESVGGSHLLLLFAFFAFFSKYFPNFLFDFFARFLPNPEASFLSPFLCFASYKILQQINIKIYKKKTL